MYLILSHQHLIPEGLECQDVVAALERHISWHGVPAVLYEDNGTQLVSLEGLKIEHQVLNSGTKSVLERNPRDVSIIVGVNELAVNTRDVFSRLVKEEEGPSQPSTL